MPNSGDLKDEYGRVPDVSGYILDKALEILRERGVVNVSVIQTAAPRLRDTEHDGASRVIRQSVAGNGTLELLVCNMNI